MRCTYHGGIDLVIRSVHVLCVGCGLVTRARMADWFALSCRVYFSLAEGPPLSTC